MGTSEAVAAAGRFGIDVLKTKQEDVIKAFVGGRDMFICMPTGYGKSLCFMLLQYIICVWSPLCAWHLAAVAFDRDLQTRQGCEVLLIKKHHVYTCRVVAVYGILVNCIPSLPQKSVFLLHSCASHSLQPNDLTPLSSGRDLGTRLVPIMNLTVEADEDTLSYALSNS